MTRWLRTAGVVAAVAATSAQGRVGPLESLAQAERAFARMSVETTQREAFLASFADDGVWFTPAPTNTKDALRKQAVPEGPPARTLDWEPATGDVAASGDLGYTTGPYTSTPRAPGKAPTTGWFFSVWRWRSDVNWKVAADFGIEAPASGPLRPREFKRAEVHGVAPGRKVDASECVEQLRAADTAFAEEASARGAAAAYQRRSTGDVRAYRQGVAPIVGRAAVVALMTASSPRLAWRPSYAEGSAAGDLGFTYGAYTLAANGGADRRGYYLHVWKRQPDGWKLAVDVTNQ